MTIPSTLHTGHFNEYFIKNSNNLFLFIIPLSNQMPDVSLKHYHNGVEFRCYKFFLYKGSNLLIKNLFYYLYYLYVIFFILPKKTIVFITTPQYCIFDNLFFLLKKIRVVYHVGDYYPESKGLMRLYQSLIHYYNQKLKYVVYCSPLLEKILRTNKVKKNGNRDYWVFGIKKREILITPQVNLLGYVGVLRPGQGFEIILDALKKRTNLKLQVIGIGPSLNEYKKLVKKIDLTDRVKFFGLINDEKKIIQIVKHWEIAIAPYDPRSSNMTLYGDPSKIKFYIEHYLPVIMTKITYLSKEIKKYHAGELIDFDSNSLIKAIYKIQKNYFSYQAGVKQMIKKYEFNKLYNKKFKFFKFIFK